MRERGQDLTGKDHQSDLSQRKQEAYKDFDELYEKLDIGVSDAATLAFDVWRQDLLLESSRDLIHAEIEMRDMRGESPSPYAESILETIASKWIRLEARKERIRMGLAVQDQSGDELNKFDQTLGRLKDAFPQLEDIELENVLAPGMRYLGPSFGGVSSVQEMAHHPDLPTEKLARASAKHAVWRELEDLYGWVHVPQGVELSHGSFTGMEHLSASSSSIPQPIYEQQKPKWRNRAKDVFTNNLGKLKRRRNK